MDDHNKCTFCEAIFKEYYLLKEHIELRHREDDDQVQAWLDKDVVEDEMEDE